MPRLIESKRCPHCGETLPEPKPRVCPECMGSIQQRFLKAGCITAAPPVVLLALGLFGLLFDGRAETAPEDRRASPSTPAPQPGGDRDSTIPDRTEPR